NTWEPIEHLPSYEQEIAAFRTVHDKKNDAIVAASARKREVVPSAEASNSGTPSDETSTDEDGWIEGLGGRRKVPVWRNYKVKMDPADNREKVSELQCKIQYVDLRTSSRSAATPATFEAIWPIVTMSILRKAG
ncbi:hypothetical protein CYMTET_40390, partial [Cymbomonas tetramitiformis]